MALPRLLMQVIDPAQAYFDEHRLDRGPGDQPVHRGATVFGPSVPGVSRPATDAERAAHTEAAARHRTDHEADSADVVQRWGPELHRAADELLATGATELVLGDRTVHARLVRFWRGDCVLETTTQAPHSDGRSLSRISRDPRRGGRDVLAAHLANAAIQPWSAGCQGREPATRPCASCGTWAPMPDVPLSPSTRHSRARVRTAGAGSTSPRDRQPGSASCTG